MSPRLIVRHGSDDRTFADGPDRGRVLVSGSDTGGAYGLIELTVAPAAAEGYGAHLHHGCEETFLLRRGRLDFLLGDEVVSLGPGDFVRAPPGMRHGYANRSREPVELLVSFHPGGLEELFLKHRTDAAFKADAERLFGSVFDLD
ncbi:MAG TPA: cupin domain-containing protein [Caulobacteraceae bacterium]|nr:cupin domain-containing protein [Caulobacteraceae bacterium]